jgi:hypothetical protein
MGSRERDAPPAPKVDTPRLVKLKAAGPSSRVVDSRPCDGRVAVLPGKAGMGPRNLGFSAKDFPAQF